MDERQKLLDEKLGVQGWERRTVIGEPRLSEIVEEYQFLGFEVHLEPVVAGDPETGCDECFDQHDTTRIVYTRKQQ
jgi:hypothetical protein